MLIIRQGPLPINYSHFNSHFTYFMFVLELLLEDLKEEGKANFLSENYSSASSKALYCSFQLASVASHVFVCVLAFAECLNAPFLPLAYTRWENEI